MKALRLDKYLSDMNVETRSRLKQLIAGGQVRVNGQVVKRAEQKVVPGRDSVICQGQEILYQEMEYYMLHKPAGCITAREDPREQTVMDLLPSVRRRDLFPVGRLDKDTEGLLLITNDGALSHMLLSPRHHVAKVYEAKVDRVMTQEDRDRFQRGMDIGDPQPTLPAGLEIIEVDPASQTCRVRITLTEGRYHQVKRMVEAVGKQVTYLKRLSMGSLLLDDSLEKGRCRRLLPEEIQRLKQCGKE